MATVSPRTAELALLSMAATHRLARRNGSPLPPDWQVAVMELAVVASSERTKGAPLPLPLPRSEWIGTDEAARRLDVTPRAVQLRCQRGTLPARRVGRQWLVEWEIAA